MDNIKLLKMVCCGVNGLCILLTISRVKFFSHYFRTVLFNRHTWPCTNSLGEKKLWIIYSLLHSPCNEENQVSHWDLNLCHLFYFIFHLLNPLFVPLFFISLLFLPSFLLVGFSCGQIIVLHLSWFGMRQMVQHV